LAVEKSTIFLFFFSGLRWRTVVVMNEYRIGFTMIIVLWIYCVQVHYFFFRGIIIYVIISFESEGTALQKLFLIVRSNGEKLYRRVTVLKRLRYYWNSTLVQQRIAKNLLSEKRLNIRNRFSRLFCTTQNTVIIMVINKIHDD